MGTITQTQINNGDDLSATPVNNNFTALFGEFNGNVDDNNVKASANINGSKFLNASITSSKISAEAFGSWTPSFGGFSVGPVVTFSKYIQFGKIVIFAIDLTSGTSNDTIFTMTLPVAAKSAFSIGGFTVVDNGTTKTTPGRIVTTAASTASSVFSDMAVGTWTNSGSKRLFGVGMYEAN